MIAEAKKVSVRLAGGQYDIHVEPGLLAKVGEIVRSLSKSKRAAIVTDSNVGPLHVDAIELSLRHAGFDSIRVTLPAGEEHKTLATISTIYDALLSAKVERSTPVLAVGGGVIGDMTGFAAATTLRGVPFIQVPTTLLAMVDASVGGKTGVNHSTGKNLIGAFHQPIAVLIDPRVLVTLPRDVLSDGLAECIKHDIIRDAEGFSRLTHNISRALNLDLDYLTELVAHNVAIKARVVEADPFERGERAHLNFGHTFGHALEKVSNFEISHGSAVALGMCAASFVAAELEMIDHASRRRIQDLITAAGLPTSGIGSMTTDKIIDAMFHDKKVEAAKLRFVLPDRIGHVVIRDDVPAELVRRAIESLRN